MLVFIVYLQNVFTLCIHILLPQHLLNCYTYSSLAKVTYSARREGAYVQIVDGKCWTHHTCTSKVVLSVKVYCSMTTERNVGTRFISFLYSQHTHTQIYIYIYIYTYIYIYIYINSVLKRVHYLVTRKNVISLQRKGDFLNHLLSNVNVGMSHTIYCLLTYIHIELIRNNVKKPSLSVLLIAKFCCNSKDDHIVKFFCYIKITRTHL